jgi:hypothetical protein
MANNVIDEATARLGHDVNFVGVSGLIGNGLSRVATAAQNKDLIVASFLWTDIARVAQAVIQQEIRGSLSMMLEEEGQKTKDFALARSFLRSLSLAAKSADYDNIMTFSTGNIVSEALIKEFNLTEQRSKEMSIPPSEFGFAVLTLTQKLGDAWTKASEKLNSLVSEQIDRLSGNLKSTEDDKQAVDALLTSTEDLLYDLHMRAWARRT